MSRSKLPSLRRHKGSGQGVVTLAGRDIYCGSWPSGQKTPPAAVEEQYRRAIGEWLSSGRPVAAKPVAAIPSPKPIPKIPMTSDASIITIEELLASFWLHAQNHYRLPDGSESSELCVFRSLFKTVRGMYSSLPVAEFTPLKLSAIRDSLVEKGLSRVNINKMIQRMKHVIKWGVGRELVPPMILQGLQAVSGLQRGRTLARERPKVKPASRELVERTIPHLPTPVANIVRLLMLTGARCGELVQLKPEDIDRTGPVWIFTPKQHKTAHKGKDRHILLGPRSQAILLPLLDSLEPTDFVFSPRRFVEEQLAERSRRRKSKRWQSHIRFQALKRKTKKKRSPGEQYKTAAVGHAIARACAKAIPRPKEWERDAQKEKPDQWQARLGPVQLANLDAWKRLNWWSVHQLRHLAATEIRKEFSLEHASSVLGHAGLDITQRYAELGLERAVEVATKIG